MAIRVGGNPIASMHFPRTKFRTTNRTPRVTGTQRGGRSDIPPSLAPIPAEKSATNDTKRAMQATTKNMPLAPQAGSYWFNANTPTAAHARHVANTETENQ